jgi:hypothetical protein
LSGPRWDTRFARDSGTAPCASGRHIITANSPPRKRKIRPKAPWGLCKFPGGATHLAPHIRGPARLSFPRSRSWAFGAPEEDENDRAWRYAGRCHER